MRLLGALVNSSIGDSLPPARMVPFMTRLVTFLMASAPPRAATYFSIIWSAVTAAAPGAPGAMGVAAGRAGASESSTGGEFTGRIAPRWQEKQVTCNWPRKLSLLMAACMAIISRAVFLAPLSSASILPCTWQKAHSTPSEDAIQHASWSAIEIAIKSTRGGTALEIRDNGKGFDTSDLLRGCRGLGLLSMEHYAAQAGLDLSITSNREMGTDRKSVV